MFGRFAGEEQGDAVKGVLATNNPSKRMPDPSEIAKLAVYLASDDSAYIVGADFLIDGGVSAISPVGAWASLRRVGAFPISLRQGTARTATGCQYAGVMSGMAQTEKNSV